MYNYFCLILTAFEIAWFKWVEQQQNLIFKTVKNKVGSEDLNWNKKGCEYFVGSFT